METAPHVSVERVTAPAVEPLAAEEVKLFLRIEHDEDDDIIDMLIVTVREAAEAWTGRSLITQSQRMRLVGHDCGIVTLLRGPVQSIQTVEAVNDGVGVTVDPGLYRLHAARGILQMLQVPYAQELVITYVAGFGDAAGDVPSLIRQGMLQHVAQLYENREAAGNTPELARALYQPYREMRL